MLALERELEWEEGTSNQDDGEEPDDGDLEPDGKWDDHILDDDLKLTGKVEGGSPKKKILKRKKAKGRRSGEYSTNSTKDHEMSNLVKDVQEALKGMAVSMSDLAAATKGNRGRAERRRKKGDPDSDESSEDEDTPPVKSRKKCPAKAATAEQKYYYAVAKGRVSGVYTNWGQASKQVNGFSGALHKKFKSRVDAERFVKKYREPETNVSESSSGPPESKSEDSSENKLPKAKPRKTKPRKERGFLHWNLRPRTLLPGTPRNFST
jgi:hypothetical protein